MIMLTISFLKSSIFKKSSTHIASHADVLWLVTRGGTRDKPKNVCVGGYHSHENKVLGCFKFSRFEERFRKVSF